MESCVAEEGATKEGCQCTLDEIKASMSYEDFKRVDTALAVDGDLDSVTPELRQKFVDSIAECRE
jgi:hypothetical protein